MSKRAPPRNEHALARQRVTPYLKRIAASGVLWYVKLGAWRWVVGLPDYVLCVRGHFVAIELKHPTDAASAASARQRYVLERILRAGGTIAVCRDVDDVREVITRALAAEHGLAYAFDAR